MREQKGRDEVPWTPRSLARSSSARVAAQTCKSIIESCDF
jgi:hypothetical protein